MEIGTVFGIIFTLILMSALVIFGFIVMSDISEQMELQQIVEEVDKLQEIVTNFRLMTGTGSTDDYALQIPATSTFCFVNASDPSPQISRGWNPNSIVQSMIIENEYNLWYYYQNGKKQEGKKINHLTVSEDFGNFCADNGAKLQLEKTGPIIEISIKE